MNPRRRRGVILIGLAALGGLGVFVAIASYVAEVRGNLTPTTTAVFLSEPAFAMAPIRPDMVRLREVPRRWAPPEGISDPQAMEGLVPPADLPAGTQLQAGMLVPPPEIAADQREISVMISADTGVAGKIQSGDLVDIEATFAGEVAGEEEESVNSARTIIRRAEIVTVATPRPNPGRNRNQFLPEEGSEDALPSGGSGAETVVPVTFALGEDEVLVLTYAESFAEEVRLARLRPDSDVGAANPREYTLPDFGGEEDEEQ